MSPVELLSAYDAARAEHQRARRLMDEAEERFERLRKKWRKRLGKRAGQEHAYVLAGVSLADRRSVNAYARIAALRAQIMARPELVAALKSVVVGQERD